MVYRPNYILQDFLEQVPSLEILISLDKSGQGFHRISLVPSLDKSGTPGYKILWPALDSAFGLSSSPNFSHRWLGRRPRQFGVSPFFAWRFLGDPIPFPPQIRSPPDLLWFKVFLTCSSHDLWFLPNCEVHCDFLWSIVSYHALDCLEALPSFPHG
jgi:hypothetical protein